MSMRTLGCAACAAFLVLVTAGPAGAEAEAKAAEPTSETSAAVTTAEADETTVDATSTGSEVDVNVGPIVHEVETDSLGRTISTYYCRTLSVARVQRTLFGFVAFKFWQRKRWCWSYPRILSREVSTYVTNVDPNYQYKGVVSSWGNWYVWCCGNPYSGHVSFRQGRFSNCILKIGCLGDHYPWVRIKSRADGSYAWATGT